MRIGYIGLGKMGKNMVLRLLEQGHQVVAWNRSQKAYEEVSAAGAETATSLTAVVATLQAPRTVWLMLPAGEPTHAMIEELSTLLSAGDTVIDGANSFYKDSQAHSALLAQKNIHFIDAGVSGGPAGARTGACLMIGGERSNFEAHEPVFKAIAAPNSYMFFDGAGAGHFVKMVHNGIEYGMMQAIAEGFTVLKQSEYKVNLLNAAKLYNRGSVIESRLIGWLESGLAQHGEEMSAISGSIAHSGEGQWTVQTAKELKIPVPVIEDSLQFRIESQKNPSFTGRLVSLLRNQFGGHDVSQK